MSYLLEYMHEIDICTIEKIERFIDESEIDVLISSLNQVRDLVHKDWEIGTYSPYSFVPSMDLSAFGGCQNLECKLDRANSFSKYAALYCDTVYLYVPHVTTPHEIIVNEKESSRFRNYLFSIFALINLYAPLIEYKIARIVPPNFSLCEECYKEALYCRSEIDSLSLIAEELSKRVEVIGENYWSKIHTGFIRIANLREVFPDHDGIRMINSGPFLSELETLGSYPKVIKNDKLVSKLVKSLVEEEYYNTKFEAFMSMAYKSKFITAKISNKNIIETINAQTTIKAKTALPIYDMPIIESVSIEDILKMRHHEQEAFNQYRVALDKAIKEHYEGQTQIEIDEVYDDIVYPAFIKLEAALKRIRSLNRKKTAGSILLAGSTVTIGLLNGIIPANAAGIMSALGGTALFASISKTTFEQLADTSKMRENDYYFLWRLKEKRSENKAVRQKRLYTTDIERLISI